MAWFDGHVRDLGVVDEQLLGPLRRRALELSDFWAGADRLKPNHFACFDGVVEHIVFRYPQSQSDHRLSGDFPFYRKWASMIDPIIEASTTAYGFAHGQVSRIMLAKLLAGGELGVHVDAAPSAEVPHKIHVPLVTESQVVFVAEDQSYHLAAGRAWEVNNRVPHGGRNPSSIDRIHLIFDYFDADGAHSS
ncbi:MAG: aspartyl/asparaginyl beta-hydroxylase domain-containing protein [Candidatus Eremiobacteraeota bacterium]|nr:aspartyl/asparaginyl beta-hydroxylase domain-containing protein [Candidatus Eremiobacteraeota bacterium]